MEKKTGNPAVRAPTIGSHSFQAYNRYFGRLSTGKMKIRGEMAWNGDTPENDRKMKQELFDVLAKARCI